MYLVNVNIDLYEKSKVKEKVRVANGVFQKL